MLEKFAKYIIDRVKPEIIEVNGELYCNQVLHQVEEKYYYPEPLKFTSLTSFIEYLNCDKLGETTETTDFIMIEAFNKIKLTSTLDDREEREDIAICEYKKEHFGFALGQYYRDNERFIIDIIANFKMDENLEKVIKVASNLSAKSELQQIDSGINQNVTVKKGISLMENIKIENPIMLKPLRTFSEIDPIELPFIFRIKREEEKPVLALFDTHSSIWEEKYKELIKEYIDSKNVNLEVF